ncbi:MAG TPA: TetR/AcrR family transcriptional regulator [Myxococcota bacterium]|nr:TetR/AcrR family transcriptional regulator [Myxococcota bacterium]
MASNAASPHPVPPRPAAGERRAQILRAAMDCFAARGFRGTTTRDIATRVGITEAALYRHFPSKEALYAAIVEEKMAAPEWMEVVAEAAAAGDDRGVFAGLAHALLASAEDDPSFLRILLYTGLEGHAQAAPFFATRVRRLREFLAEYIARRTREGVFRAIDPVLSARAFLGMVMDFVIVREVFQQRDAYPHAREEAADVFVGLFLDGVRRTGASHG